MTNKPKTYFALITALSVVFIIYMGWWMFIPRHIYPASIMVEPGDQFYKVVVKLKDRDIVGSPWMFSKIGIMIGLDKKVIPGRYDFSKQTSNYRIMRKFWKGEIAVLNITIPEGYSLTQIGALLHQRCGTNRERFDSLVRDSIYLLGLKIRAGFAEGYLFPETYRFQWAVSAKVAIETMVASLRNRMTADIKSRCKEMNYNLHQLLTMASIVEMEGSIADEFPVIASVYRNRLNINMKLQADPTVIYGMGGLNRNLLVKDYQFPSNYNTYIHKGLPPSPICSPSMVAIMAALYPDSTDYLYFVADGTGRHRFNKTYQAHLRDTRDIKKSQ